MSHQPGFQWRVLAWQRKPKWGDSVEMRYKRSDGVKFDELVIDDWFHIEEMDSRHYWMQVCDRHINVVVPSKGRPYISSEWTDSGGDPE